MGEIMNPTAVTAVTAVTSVTSVSGAFQQMARSPVNPTNFC